MTDKNTDKCKYMYMYIKLMKQFGEKGKLV